MKKIDSIIHKIRTELLIAKEEIEGCTKDEVKFLNSLVLKNTNRHLPKTYIDFLSFGGHKIGSVLQGMGFSYHQITSRMQKLYNTTKDNKFTIFDKDSIIPNNAFLFSYKSIHPNHYSFFLLGEEKDPTVYEFGDSSRKYINTGFTFTEYLASGIEHSKILRNKIPLEYRTTLFYVKAKVLSIRKKLKPDMSLEWRQLTQNLDFFLEDVDEMIYNSVEKNKILYNSFEHFFSELLSIVIPSIIKKEGEMPFTLSIQETILNTKEYVSYHLKEKDFELIESFKNRISNYISEQIKEKNDLKTAETYISTWKDNEIKVTHQKEEIRIRAKWFKPQLIYYYNQKAREIRK